MDIRELFFEDTGAIPNSCLPLLIYRQIFQADEVGAGAFEQLFHGNGWTNSWRNGIYSFHHYHSNTHEVLGCYRGTAEVLFGGESGCAVELQAGEAVLIPAGVGHKRLKCSNNFAVAGAYPQGMTCDMMHGMEGERPAADARIATVPRPAADPVLGKSGGLLERWG